MNRSSAALALAVLAAAAVPAASHPHVWIDNVTTFAFKDGKLAAIKLQWTFDEVFGADIIAQFDKNKDKRFDEKEIAALEKGAFANLREYGYFTHLSVDDKPVPTRTVTGFAARIDKGALVYEFTVPVDPPVDPLRGRVALGVYDTTYFVDVEIGGRESVKFEGAGGMDCSTQTAENPRKRIYEGQVIPLEMFLTCRKP